MTYIDHDFRGEKVKFLADWTNSAISQVLFVWFFNFFAWTKLVINDWDWYIKLIILTYIEHDFRGQKVKFFGWFGLIRPYLKSVWFIKFFAWMILVINDLDWCIKLIILTQTEHDFRDHKVKFLPYLHWFDNIFSPVHPVFKIFCMININQKWFKKIKKFKIIIKMNYAAQRSNFYLIMTQKVISQLV